MTNPSMSGAPIIRVVSWSAATWTLLILGALCAVGWYLGSELGASLACGAYLAYSLASRLLISRAHRRGVRLVRRGCYAEALAPFRESLDFFTRHAWIDRWRAWFLLSPSALSYREMAMCNLAFAYGQLGRGAESVAMYRAVLADYPQNRIAPAALRLIEAGRQLSVSETSSI